MRFQPSSQATRDVSPPPSRYPDNTSARVFGRRHFLRVLRLETWLSHIICHLHGWKRDGLRMANNVRELRSRSSDSEKITINLGYVDLGHVDLLVQEGFYSNRTDFIRTAIRNQLDRHNDAVRQSVARQQLDLGLRRYSREDLEAAQAAGEIGRASCRE